MVTGEGSWEQGELTTPVLLDETTIRTGEIHDIITSGMVIVETESDSAPQPLLGGGTCVTLADALLSDLSPDLLCASATAC